MVETWIWVVAALLGAGVSVDLLLFMYSKREHTRPGTLERLVANHYLREEVITLGGHLLALIIGLLAAGIAVGHINAQPWHGTAIVIGLVVLRVIAVGLSVMRRATWHRIERGG